MQLYVITRRSGFRDPADLEAAAGRSAAEGDKPGSGVRWIRSYAIQEESGEVGTVCVYEAESPEHIRAHARASEMIRMGKIATPVTIKTFLPANEKVGDITVAQYLARLAAEATTVINAADYGRAIYDLAIRRSLIRIGEDMVNIAFDAPLDMEPKAQIEDAERRLFELAETGR